MNRTIALACLAAGMIRVLVADDPITRQRERMVADQIESRGIRCWSASSPGLSPQFRSDTKSLIR